jgi:hypothetical protein
MTIKKKPILDKNGRPSKSWIQAMSKLQQWKKQPYVRPEDKKPK